MRIQLLITIILSTLNVKAQTLPSIADKFVEIENLKIAYKDEGEYSGQTEPLNPGQTEPVIPVKLSHLRV